MANIKQFSFVNLSEDGKLGFRLPQSEPQFNWRNNPSILQCRQLVKNRIQVYLAQSASGEFTQETSMLATFLESQLFMEALSKNDYLDEEKFYDRLRNLIARRWFEVSSQQEASHATSSLPRHAFAPTHGMLKTYSSTNFNKSLHNHIMTNNAGSNLAYAPNHLAAVPRSTIYGPPKFNLDPNLQQSDLVLPNYLSSVVGTPNAESVDSETTYSGSVLQYDSEASFESNRYKFQGENDLVMSGDQSSPSVQTPTMAGENSKYEVFTVSDDVHMQQPILGPLQCGQQLFRSESHGHEISGDMKSFGRLAVHSRKSHASQNATSISSNIQQCTATKILCCYISYNCRKRHGVPFLEYLHLQNCKVDTCSCERYKLLLSHYDSCGSAKCEICGPALVICSEKGIIQTGLRNERNVCKRLVCGDNSGGAESSEDFMSSLKSRKLNSSVRGEPSCDVSGLTEEPISPSEPLSIEQLSTSPVPATIAKLGANVELSSTDNLHLDDVPGYDVGHTINSSEDPSKFEMGANHIDDSPRMIQAGLGTQNLTSNSADAIKISDDLSANLCQKIEPAFSEHKNKIVASCCKMPSDSVDNLCEDSSVAKNVEIVMGSDEEESRANISRVGFPSTADSCIEMKSEKQKVDGITLIDYFTSEEVKEHMSSLRQKVDQGSAEETVGNEASCSLSSNICQLCALGVNVAFSIMPMYCSFCAARIKNHATYYSTKDESCEQYCFCTSCYNKCHRSHFTLHGLSIPKTSLEARKNDLVTVESWVQCDRCEGWQHQICALYNDNKDLGGQSEYLCPRCYLKDLEFGGRMPLPRSTSMDASDLPQTLLSDHLEQRLFRRLIQERENRAKAVGKNPEEVPQPADLVIRVVSSVDKILTVKQQFLDIFPDKCYPAEFPYRSKVILLFQRIEGVDVCLFAMYVQEFGSACRQPNQRCVYISYLDSVKYFRPDIKTAKGEALRTFVYHEILVGYLDYCKKRGFTTCYIWACPPVKGEDYILYCHPETQKTPNPDKLRQWYQSMLKKATEEKIVVSFTNLYEKFFVHTGECNTKVTAARLPYFEGDYWSSVVENMIQDIELESGGDPQKKVKKMNRRSLKALGHINPSADDAKDILLMEELKKKIVKAKEDFIIVCLQFVCTHCHEVILSGQRWFCSQCKNYQLCGRCHGLGEQSGGLGNTHLSSGGQKHALLQEMVNDVPVDTEDNDEIMDRCFLENRHALLSFCQGNHYQFDSLRRAKHSSMMILYHLHNFNGSSAGNLCNLCLKDTGSDPRWICKICPEFNVCNKCYSKDPSCHNHTLRSTKLEMPALVKQLLDVLLHASRCYSQPCSYPYCALLRKLFSHAHACNIRVGGGCRHCKKAWSILMMHSQRCKDSNCGIPRCMDLKNYARTVKPKNENGLLDNNKQSVF